ncbi:DMT family transporter [Cyanobium sp. FGCU-6]|nr:DMT family transporter [Cyanobium sp. FGCU6]
MSGCPVDPAAAAAALAAALCWTVASLLWRRLPTSLGAGQLNLLKNLLALGLQLPLVLGGPWQASPRSLALLALSGIVGIAFGDGLFFAALRRLGTRRTLTLDAGGPAVTALAGMVLLGEVPRLEQWLGLALISGAVLLVVRRGAAQSPGAFPQERPAIGVLLALGALVCGSTGALLSRAALSEGGATPLQAATVRLAAASLVLLPLLPGLLAPRRRPRPARPRWPVLLLATLLGTSAGIVLQQTALAGLPGGLAVALLATAPVMAVPLARLDGDRPGIEGVIAALVALAGVSLVVGLPWRS